jgi:hypothetical protein
MDIEELNKLNELSVNTPRKDTVSNLKRGYTFRNTPTRKQGVGAYAFDRYV